MRRLPSIRARILVTLAVLALVPAAHGQYVQSSELWTASSADTWQTKDLSGSPYNVPANAVVEVAVMNDDGGYERWGGVRAVGSSLNRRFQLHEAERVVDDGGNGGDGNDVVVMHVQTNASSQIQHYADDTSDVRFVLLGYWTSGTYVETWQSFTAGGSGSWRDHDLDTYGVGDGQVAEIVMINNASSNERIAGVRTDGSSLSRRVTLHEPESGGDDLSTMFVAADSDGTARIEVYASSNSDVAFQLVGYWSTPPAVFTEKFVDIGGPGSDGTWQDKDLSSYGVPSDGIAEVTLAQEHSSTANNIGVRANGTSIARYIDVHEAESGGADLVRMHVLADDSSLIDWYFEDVSDSHSFYLTGFWSNSLEIQVRHVDDDAEEDSGGGMSLNNDKMELGQKRHVGVRFYDVNLPVGATISSAYVEWRAYDPNTESTDITIYGEDTDDAARFTSSNNDINGRTKTSASVSWNSIPNWSSNTWYQTPDITTIIQEIVDRGGWASGNAMAILFRTEDYGGKRLPYSYDGGAANAAKLFIEYTTSPTIDLADHDAGQESDAFSESGGETDAELLAFNLDANAPITVTELVFTLSSITGLSDGDWSNVEIVEDTDGNGTIDGGESTTIGGSGIVDQSGGTITFSTSFAVSSATNYILRADFSSLSDDDTVTIDLAVGGFTTTATVNGALSENATHLEKDLPCYVETQQTWSASSSDTWQTQNLSGFGVPADAVVEVAVRNASGSYEYWGGVRAVGSSIDRRLQLHEAESGDFDMVVMHVQADSSSRIQHYADSTGQITFQLLGYWTCGTYTEAWDLFTSSFGGAWIDEDLNAYGVPADAIAEVVVINNNTSIEYQGGVRASGSSLERRVDLQEAESGGDDALTMLVKAGETSDATIEIYAESSSQITFRLAGWWSDAPGTYSETFADIGSPTVDNTWQDVGLSSYGVTPNVLVDLAIVSTDLSEEVVMGARSNGSTLSRTVQLMEAEAGGGDAARMHVLSDGTSTIEFYHIDVSDPHTFYLMGYWGPLSGAKRIVRWQEVEP